MNTENVTGLGLGLGMDLGLERLRDDPGENGGPSSPHLVLVPPHPPARLWATGSQVAGKRLLGDGCQVTTVVSRAEGSRQLVGQERGRWANSGGPSWA